MGYRGTPGARPPGKKYLSGPNRKSHFSLSTSYFLLVKKSVCFGQQITLLVIRVRVIRERLSATPGHVIGQGPAPGGGVVPCGGGGGECTFLRYYGISLKQKSFWGFKR